MQGRCVWTDERGDRGVQRGQQRRRSAAHPRGYRGRDRPVCRRGPGDYTFQWQYVVDAEDGAVSGRVVDPSAAGAAGSASTAPAGGPNR